jgi:hypothetical protein
VRFISYVGECGPSMLGICNSELVVCLFMSLKLCGVHNLILTLAKTTFKMVPHLLVEMHVHAYVVCQHMWQYGLKDDPDECSVCAKCNMAHTILCLHTAH